MVEINKEQKTLIISFSGGRTSAFMAQWILKSKKYKDWKIVVVFANTGKEKEATLEFVHKCDKEFGLNVIWLEAVVNPLKGKGTRHKIVDFKSAARNGEPFEEVIKKYTIPNMKFIHCTRELKMNPIKSYIRSLGLTIRKGNYAEAIGIRSDETHRINWEAAKKNGKIYPLVVDYPIEEGKKVNKDSIRLWWNKQDFDLQLKDYEGNCDLCYKKSNRKLLTLISENPDSLKWWAEMEAKYGGDSHTFFRGNNSALDLLELSKQPFEKAIDGHTYKVSSFGIMDDMDSEKSCTCGEY